MIHSAEEFVRLRSSHDAEDYGRAATEEAPLGVWFDVIDRFPEFKEWVAHNKTVPFEVLEVLATDPDQNVRFMVATKNKLSPGLLETLAFDRDPSVRLRVATHKRASRALLERMRSDSWAEVRAVAAARLASS